MFSEITQDRLKAAGYYGGVFTACCVNFIIGVDVIRTVANSSFYNREPLSFFDQLPISRSLRERIFIVIGGVTLFLLIAKITSHLSMEAYRLSHIKLQSWRWSHFKSE